MTWTSTTAPKQSRNWLATVINPATPISDPNTANQLDDLGLYSFDPTFTPPSYEPADFDYDKTFDDVATNTYGRPYTPSDLMLPHRASSNDDFPPYPMPSSGPTPVEPAVVPAQAPNTEPEMKKRGRGRPKGSKRVNKQHKEEREVRPSFLALLQLMNCSLYRTYLWIPEELQIFRFWG